MFTMNEWIEQIPGSLFLSRWNKCIMIMSGWGNFGVKEKVLFLPQKSVTCDIMGWTCEIL
jgi:hypothetical protein